MKYFVMVIIGVFIFVGVLAYVNYPAPYINNSKREFGIDPIVVNDKPTIFLDEIEIVGSLSLKPEVKVEKEFVCGDFYSTKINKGAVRNCEWR